MQTLTRIISYDPPSSNGNLLFLGNGKIGPEKYAPDCPFHRGGKGGGFQKTF